MYNTWHDLSYFSIFFTAAHLSKAIIGTWCAFKTIVIHAEIK